MAERNLLVPSDVYIPQYPEAVDFVNKQINIFWFPEEINVEKDVQDILVNLTESERHGVITTLKLFTKYELIVGDEYWTKLGTIIKKPACISRMANCFSFMEQNVHAPFYSKINEALGLANNEFYTEYLRDDVLRERIEMLEKYASSDKLDEFLAALAFIEGVVLYSSFAYLKHFQSQGKNKILNIVRGINFSARDEGLHSEASAWMYRILHEESGEVPNAEVVRLMANVVREHEHQIVDKIFEHGEIEGITPVQMKHFIDSRINVVMRNLGFTNLYEVKYNPIGEWFYKGINDYTANDFFSGQGREYKRDWDEGAFEW
jgi:ribonucleoside-diphosphate reductase beta chain